MCHTHMAIFVTFKNIKKNIIHLLSSSLSQTIKIVVSIYFKIKTTTSTYLNLDFETETTEHIQGIVGPPTCQSQSTHACMSNGC